MFCNIIIILIIIKMLCKYKNIFGKPNEGVHKHFLGIAWFDLIGTLLICFLIWRFTRLYNNIYNLLIVCIIGILLGILFHRIFCVNTTLNKSIFGKV
jgi:hypothetical protein